ncbi:hypothetical protein MJM43_33695, partial [Salmonella enterica subsp. enterica serovar Montevideo]|nr:hypothetical protein [Salmonella enterica subsp. enterica serovar Montevideo]
SADFAQFRGVNGIGLAKFAQLKGIAELARRYYSVRMNEESALHDNHFDNQPIDLPLDVLLGKTPKMTRDVQTLKAKGDALNRA